MNIFFDLDIKFLGFFDKCLPEEQAALQAIWNYVYDRIVFLIDEIELEEAQSDNPKAIMIYLMNDPKAIQPNGYSQKLCDKINGCFNENDRELLWKSVETAIKPFLN